MDAFTISAASGMRARLESLEMLANNMANQSSPGFRADREAYGLYVASEAQWPQDAGAVSSPVVPVIERHWTDFRQGQLRHTGETFDVALDGPGFFVVQSGNGELLTRNGNFRLSRGGQLETQDGFAVLDSGRRPIRLDANARIEINTQGEIFEDGAVAARIGVANPENAGGLAKREGTYFAGAPGARLDGAAAGVHQGRLESSNLAPAEGAVRLVHVLRQFESLTKAVQIHAEMNRRAEELARVNG